MDQLFRAWILLGCLIAAPLHAFAQSPSAGSAQTIVHVLDYIAVDYAGAVQDGKVTSADEFKEMIEFAGEVVDSLRALPRERQQPSLVTDAEKLARMVKEKAPAENVAAAARKLRWDIIGAYNVAVSPKKTPDLAAGASLYRATCAGCHGTEGKGDGPAGVKLDPRPSDFHDGKRMMQRSVYGLYNTVTLGVKGTAMAAYGEEFTDEQRWALAFHVAGFLADAKDRVRGEKLWKDGKDRQAFPDLVNVVTLSAREVTDRHGEETAAMRDYLIAHPGAVAAVQPAPIPFALAQVQQALDAYRKGDRKAALQSAITAYVEGYELIERSLANVAEKLMREGERDLMALRDLIRNAAPY